MDAARGRGARDGPRVQSHRRIAGRRAALESGRLPPQRHRVRRVPGELVSRVLIIAVLLVILAGAAHADEITLPADHPYGALKPGAGSELTQRSCVLCHST